VPDGEGLAPDYPAAATHEDWDRGVDEIISRATELLRGRLGDD
jgi:hypothetical protein